MAREPFRPDFLFSRIVDVHFGSTWLAVTATGVNYDPIDPNAQLYKWELMDFNPAASGMQQLTFVEGSGGGGSNAQNGQPLTPEQNASNILVYQAVQFGGGPRGVVLINIDKLRAQFPNPTFQFDIALSYDQPLFNPNLTNTGFNVELIESPRGVRNGIVAYSRLVAATSNSTAIVFTGQDLLWKTRIFLDMTQPFDSNALSNQQLFP